MYAKVPPGSKSSTSSQLHSQTSFGSSSFSVQRQAKKAKGSKAIPIQAKLTIGEPGDKYEQEADRVAAQVVNQINAPCTQQQSQNLQREATSEEDELQMKLEVDTIQRKEIIEAEEELQMKPILQLQSGAGGMTATPELETSIQQARSGGQSLADNIRQPMEQAFGADFSGVKIHTDSQADQLNRATQARAFTTGQDVFFRSGEYNPGSRGGQELIAHELTHVVQQQATVTRSIQRMPPKKGPNPLKQKLKAGEDVAGEAKADNLADYTKLLAHMGGEFDGTNVTGGHLLAAMQEQWGEQLQWEQKEGPNSAGIWKMDWSISGVPKAGGSTMFPESWSLADLQNALNNSTQSRNGRVFTVDGQEFNVKKSGDTFYPEY